MIAPQEFTQEEAPEPYFCISVLSVDGQRLKQLRLERKFPKPVPIDAAEPEPDETQPATDSKKAKNREKTTDNLSEGKARGGFSIPAGFGNKDVEDGGDLPVTS